MAKRRLRLDIDVTLQGPESELLEKDHDVVYVSSTADAYLSPKAWRFTPDLWPFIKATLKLATTPPNKPKARATKRGGKADG